MVLERRNTMPQELEDPEDMTIGEAEGEMFDEMHHRPEESSSTGSTPELQSLDHHPQQEQQNQQVLITTRLQTLTTREGISQNLPKEIRNIVAGGIAGMIAKSVVAPVERIKILYQVTATEFHLRNLPEVTRNIIKNEGASAMWKGNTATLLRVFPYSGIQFMVFDRLKTHFLSQKHHFLSNSNSTEHGKRKWGLSPLESLIAGMTAGVVSVICTYPLDLTRAQLAVLKRHKFDSGTLGFYEVLTNNYRKRGVTGLFRGITPTLGGIIPYSGLAFTMNEQGKRKIQMLTSRDLTTTERMQCGAMSGVVAQSVTYPIEVIRRRMQTIGMVGNDTAFNNIPGVKTASGDAIPPSFLQTIRNVHAEQGFRGFYKGVSMNWIKGPVAFSISFTAFDTVQGLMESDSERASRIPQRTFTRKE